VTSCVKMVLRNITNKGVITMDQSNFNTIEGSRKLGHHLTLDERGMIQALHEQGYSLRGISPINTPPISKGSKRYATTHG